MKARVSSGRITGAAGKTLVTLINTATRRAKLLQVIIGCSDTPDDQASYFQIKTFTADGTGTAGSGATAPAQLDRADGGPVITSKNAYTVEPTYDTGGIEIGLHQRNTVIWNVPTPDTVVAAPVGTANGIGIQLVNGSSPAKLFNVTLIYDE